MKILKSNMRFLLCFCLVIVLFGCEDKQSKKKKTTLVNEAIIPKEVEKKEDSKTKSTREYPRITDDNVRPFFLKYGEENKENKVRITTDFGDIDILLFNETRYHRANFIFLAKQEYFDATQFYRIVKNFIIQGGNSDSGFITRKRRRIGKYLLPTDTKYGFRHDRGVVSMPSSDIENPYKLASPYEFFIVQQRGGAHHLNGDYTIFGKVIKGMDVVDKIAAQEADAREWPVKNVYIRSARVIE